MSKYRVTPAILKTGFDKNQGWLLSDDAYILCESTTWPFKWAANLHVKYLIWLGYNCVNMETNPLKGNGE
jgi:hypothetical protein